jgi:hypothetical protein
VVLSSSLSHTRQAYMQKRALVLGH